MKSIIGVVATRHKATNTIAERNRTLFNNLYIVENNTRPLAQVYNEFHSRLFENSIVVFMHDDVLIEDRFFGNKIRDMKDNAILGLAGATGELKIPPHGKALWHLMCQERSGFVCHPTSNDAIASTSFGPSPQRCIIMDGLFLAVDMGKILDAGIEFDESNPSIAHFYDLDYCLTANKNKLKMSTVPLNVIHQSPGLRDPNEQQFNEGNDWFKSKWF